VRLAESHLDRELIRFDRDLCHGGVLILSKPETASANTGNRTTVIPAHLLS